MYTHIVEQYVSGNYAEVHQTMIQILVNNKRNNFNLF